MTHPLVLDASCVASAILPDENSAYADAAQAALAKNGAIVPDLFWYELANLLLVAERRDRLEAGQAETEIEGIRALPIETRIGASSGRLFRIARMYDLSAYDASYGMMASDLACPLATLDRRLIAAGKNGAFDLWKPE